MNLTGLTQQEVEERIRQGKVNQDADAKTKSIRQIVLEHSLTLFNFLNLVLAIMVALVGSFKNMLFMGIVVTNTVIGIVQEVRSKRMVDKLAIMVESKIEVLRDGRLKRISVEDVVMDDVLHIKRGNQIPADCIVLAGSVDMNESLLTGEADTVTKGVGKQLMSGSFVSGGDCYARVNKVGAESYVASLSRDAKVVKSAESEIMRTLKKIITIISAVLLPLGILLYWNQVTLSGATVKDAVVSTVAALVSMIPEGLMLLTSTVLVVSVVRLAQKNVLVQQLYCIETLARVDVLCLDKTGTITSGRMKANKLLFFPGIAPEEVIFGFQSLMAVSRDESPTVDAIKAYVGTKNELTPTKIIDFSSEKKWSGATFSSGVTYIMGAGEMILKDRYAEYAARFRNKVGTNRVILLCRSSQPFAENNELPEQIVPLGVILIADEIRAEAADTIRYFTEQGVELKVISGDGINTVANIAAEVGIPEADKAVDARELLTKEDVEEAAEKYRVFGRVTPQQKRQLVRALQKNGHTVAMTGDGVNDVLAMKESDCSVAMASGSDAARNTAQLVLTTDDFSSMPAVVAEGRRTINNIQRSASLFLNKTIFAMITGLLFAFISLQYPYQPIQMSFVSSLTIGLPSFVLALEPNKERIQGSFFYNIITKAFAGGVTMAVATFLSYAAAAIFHLDKPQLATMAVFLIAMTEIFLLIRISKPFNTVRSILLAVEIIGLIGGVIIGRKILSIGMFSWTLLWAIVVIGTVDFGIFTLLYDLMEKLRKKQLAKNPTGMTAEKRREKAEYRANYRASRIEALRKSSGFYRALVNMIAYPVSGVMSLSQSVKQWFRKLFHKKGK